MKKLWNKVVAILVIATMTLSLAACGGKTEKTSGESADLPKEINFGVQQMPNDETIAISQGLFDKYFTDKGIKCNFIMFDSGKAVNTALASGSIDFGLMGSSPAAIAVSLGIEAELIWIHEVLGEIESLAVSNSSGINTIEDLVGKKVATPVASTAHYSLLNGLKNAGIEDQVEILDMQPSDIVAAWERGDISAAYVWQPALGNLLKDGKIILSSKDMAAQGCVTSNVEVVTKEFSEKYPDLVASYIACLTEAANIYRDDPEKATEIVSKELEISKEDALIQMQGSIWCTPEELISSEYFGTSEEPGKLAQIMKETADFLETQDSIEKAPSQEEFNEYVNPTYIEKAMKILAE